MNLNLHVSVYICLSWRAYITERQRTRDMHFDLKYRVDLLPVSIWISKHVSTQERDISAEAIYIEPHIKIKHNRIDRIEVNQYFGR
jgi:hypothetical protein